jgi:hypothetical protein
VTLLKIKITVTDNIIPAPPPFIPYGRRLRVPASGWFMQVKQDYETAQWNYQPRALAAGFGWNQTRNPDGAFPDTFPCTDEFGNGEKRTVLTEARQRLWFEALEYACDYQIPTLTLKERWAKITEHGRALTDHTAVQNGLTDYILGLNLDAHPIQQKILVMGGNIVKVIGSTNTRWIVEGVTDYQPIETLWQKPWLLHWGTQSTIIKYGSAYKRTDWSWLNYGTPIMPYGVPYIVFSPSGNKIQIPKDFLKPIANGAEYAPYTP